MDNRNWKWASRPSGKVGKVDVYKKYYNPKKDIIKQNIVKTDIEKTIITEKPVKKRIGSVSGTYAIVCEVEKHVYIGQSIDVSNRLRSHRMFMSGRKIESKTYIKIKEHVNKHGIGAFDFRIHMECQDSSLKNLLHMESQAMADYVKMGYKLYNSSINIQTVENAIFCPEKYRDIINLIIKKIDENNFGKISDFINSI